MPKSITISKAQFDQFWDEVFGNDFYIEEWNIDGEDFDRLAAEEQIEIEYLSWGWQGQRGVHPTASEHLTVSDLNSQDAMKPLRRWLDNQTMRQFSVWVPTDKASEFDAFVARIGGHR